MVWRAQGHVVKLPLFQQQSVNIYELRRAAAGVFGGACCPSPSCHFSRCNKWLQLVSGLNFGQASSAPGLFYYEAMLE